MRASNCHQRAQIRVQARHGGGGKREAGRGSLVGCAASPFPWCTTHCLGRQPSMLSHQKRPVGYKEVGYKAWDERHSRAVGTPPQQRISNASRQMDSQSGCFKSVVRTPLMSLSDGHLNFRFSLLLFTSCSQPLSTSAASRSIKLTRTSSSESSEKHWRANE